MTAFLFLQRFGQGAVAPLPYQALTDLLARYGTPGRGRGDLEISLPPDAIGRSCTVVGDPASGANCIGIEAPRFDAALRQLVWDCMTTFGCAAFDDSLATAYVGLDQAGALPAGFAAACANGLRQISSAQQLWPDQLEATIGDPERPALCYPNANPDGPNLQLFDHAAGNELYLELAMRPEACNAGSLRVLRNFELRVDTAISANPDYRPCYRYAHHESLLRLMESPRLDALANQVTVASPMPGEAPTGPRFVADREVFFSAAGESAKLVQYLKEKHQLALDGSAASLEPLARFLDQLHGFHRQELAKAPAGQPFTSAVATNWAIKAGCYLGNVVRRQIGGQWGYVTRGRQRLLVVKTHRGAICHPQLQVLDHIINGPRDGIAGWFDELARRETSACPRRDDLACNIPSHCQLLLGTARLAGGEELSLPLADQLQREQLDYSLASLEALDRYLGQLARRPELQSGAARSRLVVAAGAYLGEVIRSNAPAGDWQWVTYDDFAALQPGFANQRPRELGFLAFLDGAEQLAYPLAQVAAALDGAPAASTRAYAGQLLAAAAPGADAADEAPADPGMAAALDGVRDALANFRRLASASDYQRLRTNFPRWMHPEDSLGETIENQRLLLEQGKVVWGALVQANNGLFEPGPEDLPAALAYSLDPHFDGRPQALRQIAAALFAHKGDQAPEPLRRLAEWLADEVERAYNLPVPELVTDREVLVSAFMVFRRHLPERVVSGAWFPILTHPGTCALLIVPREFWPQPLVAAWNARELLR